MAGFANYAAITTALAAGQKYHYEFAKAATPTQTLNGRIYSLWTATGVPAAGAQPAGTGTVYDNTTNAGAIAFQPTSALNKYLLRLSVTSDQAGTLMVFDRLVGYGSVSLTTATTLTMTAQTLPRYTSGLDVQCWLELTTSSSASNNPIVSLGYTNSAGTASRTGANTTVNINIVSSVIRPLGLQAGDQGIQSIQSLTVNSPANTTAVCNLNLMRLLATLPCIADISNERDFVLELAGMPQIFDGASLMLVWANATGATPRIAGSLDVVYA